MIPRSEFCNLKTGDKLILTKIPNITSAFKLGDIFYIYSLEERDRIDLHLDGSNSNIGLNNSVLLSSGSIAVGKSYWFCEDTLYSCFDTPQSFRNKKIDGILNLST